MLDDASRMVLAAREYEHSVEAAVELLKEVLESKYIHRIREVITDHLTIKATHEPELEESANAGPKILLKPTTIHPQKFYVMS